MNTSWNPTPPAPGTLPSAPYHQPWATTMPHAAPAYTPVQVRQSFSQTHTSSQPNMATATTQYPPQAYGQHSDSPSTTPTLPPAAQSPSEASKQIKINWSSSVRDYVQRSFSAENIDPTVTRSEMEAKLKETISQATNSGVLNTIDWDNMALPQQMIKEERARLLNVNSKKRKSSDFGSPFKSETATPPWRNNASSASLGDRISYSSKSLAAQLSPIKSKEDSPPNKNSKSKQMEKRQRRFDGGYKSTYRAESPVDDSAAAGPVVGTCQKLEKRYLRLTSAPNPANVRPEPVLRKALEFLKEKWRTEENYSYVCDQLKSLRQDLTVQRIKNDLTVAAYEVHARIALVKADMGEYNQCQTQLKSLYQQGLPGKPLEFKAYRILYFIHTANRAALNDAIKDLTPAEKAEEAIKHALDVRSSLALGNYHRFFQLYHNTPNLGAYLMDMFVERERLSALSNICKAYKPEVPLRFVTEELGFESDSEAADFVLKYASQEVFEDRPDVPLMFLSGKVGNLFEDARKNAFRRVDIKGQI